MEQNILWNKAIAYLISLFNFNQIRRRDSTASSSTLVDDITGEILFKKTDYGDTEALIFSTRLFDAIDTLLHDANKKVALAAATAVFVMLRSFQRPLKQSVQAAKDRAETVLRARMSGRNRPDRYMAAQCLALDGICETGVVNVLLESYFQSTEQLTKQQVSKTLSELSCYHVFTLLSIFFFALVCLPKQS